MNLQEAEKKAKELGHIGSVWRGSTNTVFGEVDTMRAVYGMAERLGL